MVVINIGTNDNNSANNVSAPQFQQSYIDLISGIHSVWPDSQIIIFVSSCVPLNMPSSHTLTHLTAVALVRFLSGRKHILPRRWLPPPNRERVQPLRGCGLCALLQHHGYSPA